MAYIEMRHSGISFDIKTEMDPIPRIGEIVDFVYDENRHLFRVERVIHCYDSHKLEKVYISGQEISDWLD